MYLASSFDMLILRNVRISRHLVRLQEEHIIKYMYMLVEIAICTGSSNSARLHDPNKTCVVLMRNA